MSETVSFKTCPKCKEVKEASLRYFLPTKRNPAKPGLSSWCRDCNRIYQRIHGKAARKKYAETEKGRDVNRRCWRRYAATEYGKGRRREYQKCCITETERKARQYLNNMINRGRLARGTACEKCPNEVGRRIEAHHHNGYEQEHWLDVQWLCVRCHRAADAELKE